MNVALLSAVGLLLIAGGLAIALFVMDDENDKPQQTQTANSEINNDIPESMMLVSAPQQTNPYEVYDDNESSTALINLKNQHSYSISGLIKSKKFWQNVFPNKRIVTWTMVRGSFRNRHIDGLFIHYEIVQPSAEKIQTNGQLKKEK